MLGDGLPSPRIEPWRAEENTQMSGQQGKGPGPGRSTVDLCFCGRKDFIGKYCVLHRWMTNLYDRNSKEEQEARDRALTKKSPE